MILTPSEVASISAWSTFWEVCEYVAEAVVFLGCVGEFIAEYTNVRTEHWRHTLGRRSLIILTLGIGAGLFSLIKTNALAGQVIGSLGEQAERAGKKAQLATDVSNTAILRSGQAAGASENAASRAKKAEGSASNALTLATGARREADSFEKDIASAKAQAAEAELHLAEANARAKEADAKAESFRLDIAGANKRASEADLARRQLELELAMRFADRTLTRSQIDRTVALLRPFEGQTVDVVISGDTPEITQLSGLIVDMFLNAKWCVNRTQLFGAGVVRGVLVGVNPGFDPILSSAVNSLITVLSESLIGGVGAWDFDKIPPFGTGSFSQLVPLGLPDSKPVSAGKAPLRVAIGSKL
ncbi:MAG: hypothetical protein ABSC23_21175 [Bryobacteraceae bacterium]|jgi:hypothetical protein